MSGRELRSLARASEFFLVQSVATWIESLFARFLWRLADLIGSACARALSLSPSRSLAQEYFLLRIAGEKETKLFLN